MGTYQDLSGRGPTRRSLVLWGLILTAVIVVAAIPLTIYSRGGLDDTIEVSLQSDQIGDGLATGADVKYRGLVIGKVTDVSVADGGQQQVTLSLESGQAGELTDASRANFAPSNIFGVLGVELSQDHDGATLRDGDVIAMGDDTSEVSVTGVLRDVGDITSTLTDNEFSKLIDRMSTLARDLSPLMRSGFDLMNLALERQRMPLTEVLRIAGQTVSGAGDLTEPFVSLFTTLVEKTELYADPEQTRQVTGSLTGLVQVFITLGEVVGANQQDMATMLDASLTLGAPLGYSLGSVAPAADAVPELLDRIEKSMPIQNGRPTLQLGVTLQGLPQVTSGLLASGGGR